MPVFSPAMTAWPLGTSSRLSLSRGPFHDGISDVTQCRTPDRPGIAFLMPLMSPSISDRPALTSSPPRFPIARRIIPGSRWNQETPC